MFRKNTLTVSDWLIMFILMVIPVVNVVAWIILFFSPRTSFTVKNFLFAILIVYILGLFIGFISGFGVFLRGLI